MTVGSNDATGGGWRQLPVHRLETHGGDGSMASRMTTFCPREERALPVEDCIACPRCGGLSVRTADRTFIECNPGLLVTLPSPVTPDAAVATGGPLGGARVSDITDREVVCARADASIEVVAALLRAGDRAILPIVDEEGRPVGVVDARDLVGRGGASAAAGAADVMRRHIHLVRESATLGQVALEMASEPATQVLVVDAGGCLVGLVGAIDVVIFLARRIGQAAPLQGR